MYRAILGGIAGVFFFGNAAWATCSVTNNLVNGTTADASKVYQNFTDLAGCAAPTVSPTFTGTPSISTSASSAVFLVNRPSNSYAAAVNFETGGFQKWDLGMDPALGSTGDLSLYNVTTGSASIVVKSSDGSVGIGTTSPSYLLTVNGTAYASGAAGALSDVRHKKNIKNLPDNMLDKIMQLRPVSFDWRDPKDSGMLGTQMGFVAQEVERVIPSVVLVEKDSEKTEGLKYNELLTVLTKATQELVGQIDQLKKENEIQQAEIARLQTGSAKR